MINKKMQKIVSALIGISCLLLPMTACAGDINANEARIVSAASGTFSYQGQSYVASSASMGALQAKLMADDVDLTAEQASYAITQMYSNIARGVAEGHLVKVGGDSDGGDIDNGSGSSDVDGNKGDTSDDSDFDDGGIVDDFIDNIIPNNSGDKTEDSSDGKKPASNDYTKVVLNIEEIIQQKKIATGEISVLSNESAQKTESGNEAEAENISNSNQSSSNETTSTEKTNSKINIVEAEDGTVSIDMFSMKAIQKYITIITVILAIIAAVCGIISYGFGCITVGKRKKGVSHHTKQRVRMALRIILGSTLFIHIFTVILTSGTLLGFANQKGVDTNVSASDYYHIEFDNYKADESIVLETCGYPKELFDKVTVYSTDDVDHNTILKEMDDYLTSYESKVSGSSDEVLMNDENRKILKEELCTRYEKASSSNLFDNIKKKQKMLGEYCAIILVIHLLLIAMESILLFISHHSKKKAINCLAIADVLSTIIALILWSMVLSNQKSMQISVSSEGFTLFIKAFVKWALEFYIWMIGVGGAVFCALIIWKKKRNE